MLSQSAVSSIVFFVNDIEKTQKFYEGVLDIKTQKMEGHDGAFLMAESGPLYLVFLPGEVKPGQSPVVVFGVDSGIEDLVDSLMKQDVEIVVPVSEAPDGGLTADFLDPDGHVLSLYQPAEEAA